MSYVTTYINHLHELKEAFKEHFLNFIADTLSSFPNLMLEISKFPNLMTLEREGLSEPDWFTNLRNLLEGMIFFSVQKNHNTLQTYRL